MEIQKICNFEELFEYIGEKKDADVIAKEREETFPVEIRYKEYMKEILEDVAKTYSIGSIFKRRKVKRKIERKKQEYKEHFSWSQCQNKNYNKYCGVLLDDLYNNINDYKRVYELMNDSKSKEIFYYICYWKLTLRSAYLVKAFKLSTENQEEQYFDEIITKKLTQNEVFIDAGGFTGDSVLSFLKNQPTYKSIYLYEPDIKNLEKAKTNLSNFKSIYFRENGLSDTEETLFFNSEGLSSSSVTNAETDVKINVVSLDHDVKENVSFIKMDIEGMEMKAISGAKEHIIKSTPILAICLYHKPEDIYTIPLYIQSLNGNYSFYIRHYTDFHGETVMYAIPNFQ